MLKSARRVMESREMLARAIEDHHLAPAPAEHKNLTMLVERDGREDFIREITKAHHLLAQLGQFAHDCKEEPRYSVYDALGVLDDLRDAVQKDGGIVSETIDDTEDLY